MKKLMLIIMFVLAFAGTVSAIGEVDITAIPTQVVDAGQTATFTITVQNALAGTTIPSVDFTSTTLVGPTTLPAPSISSVANLVNGTSQQVTFSVPVAANAQPGNYVGSVTATETGNGANSDNMGYTLTVRSNPSLAFSETTVHINGQPGDDAKRTFTVTNNGNVALTNIGITHTLGVLEDNNNNEINLDIRPSTIASLGVGATQNVEVEIDVDSRFERSTFSGNLVFTATQGTFTNPFEVGVRPIACVLGNRGDLEVDIREPEDDQEFRPGDDIRVEVEVTNDGTSDIRTVVQAVLFNDDEDKVVDRYTSSSKTIDEDKDYTFTFNLELGSNADEDDDYTIYVKAYERNDEEDNCDDGENLDITVEELQDYVVVDSFTVSPISPTCGEDVFGSLRVVNRGSNDADVRVQVQNSELGLNELSPTFRLDPNGRNDYDKVVNFQFSVPDDAKEKTYTVNALVHYNGIDTSETRTVSVTGCSATSTPTGATTTSTPTGSGTSTPAVEDDGVYFQEKSVFDRFKTTRGIPTSAWLLIDLVLVLLIVFLIVAVVKRSRY